MLKADEFAGDLSVAIDDVGLGVHRGAVPLRNRRMIVPGGGIAVGQEGDALVTEEFLVSCGVLVGSHTENYAAAVAILEG